MPPKPNGEPRMFSLKSAEELGVMDEKSLRKWAAVALIYYEQIKQRIDHKVVAAELGFTNPISLRNALRKDADKMAKAGAVIDGNDAEPGDASDDGDVAPVEDAPVKKSKRKGKVDTDNDDDLEKPAAKKRDGRKTTVAARVDDAAQGDEEPVKKKRGGRARKKVAEAPVEEDQDDEEEAGATNPAISKQMGGGRPAKKRLLLLQGGSNAFEEDASV